MTDRLMVFICSVSVWSSGSEGSAGSTGSNPPPEKAGNTAVITPDPALLLADAPGTVKKFAGTPFKV
jgi:hypothetical protein